MILMQLTNKIFYTKYLKILYDKDELVDLVKEAINMHQRFPQDIIPLVFFV